MKVYEVGDLRGSDGVGIVGVLIEGSVDEIRRVAMLLGQEVRVEAASVRRIEVDIVEAGRVGASPASPWWSMGAVTVNGSPEDLADLPIGPAVLEVRR